ncbi:MAG: carboxypeptidase-like regulatory domain-containing protein [Solirubrobacteraceae bacterium]
MRPVPVPARRSGLAGRTAAALATAFLFLAGTAPGAAAEPDPSGVVAGTVTDDDGGRVVAAEVRLLLAPADRAFRGGTYLDPDDLELRRSTTTDADGAFRFADVPETGDSLRPYLLHVRHDGLQGAFHWMTETNIRSNVSAVRPTPPADGVRWDVELRRLALVLRGRATDPQGRPLAGVAITASDGPFWQPADPLERTTTDADGRFALVAPRTPQVVRATRDDRLPTWTDPGGAPHTALSAVFAGGVGTTAGGTVDGVDIVLEARPDRSCWAGAPRWVGRRTVAWIAAPADDGEPTLPPRNADRCAGALAPRDVPAPEGHDEIFWDRPPGVPELHIAQLTSGPREGAMVVAEGPSAEEQARALQGELARQMLMPWLDALLRGEPVPGFPPVVLPVGPNETPVATTRGGPVGATPQRVTVPARAVVRRGRLGLRVRCATAGPCAGTVRLVATRGRATRRRTVTLARGSLRSTRRARTLRLRLTAGGRSLLRRERTVRATATWTTRAGKTARRVGRVRLRVAG